MTTLANPKKLTPEQMSAYDRDGFLIVKGLMPPDVVAAVRAKFDELGAKGQEIPDYWKPDLSSDPSKNALGRYPRVMMPHRFDQLSLQVLLDPRAGEVLHDLFGEEPIAAQTMFYFKPPGALGQAFHQDNYYLDTRPGTCMAAWYAIDPAIPENGGLFVVPGTHKLDVLCPEAASEGESFTTHLVRPPDGMKEVPAPLQPGDCLFFNGSLIHGSQPNRSTMWRRSFICHYVPRSTAEGSKWYKPYLTFDGRDFDIKETTSGGKCGEERVSSYAKSSE